MTDSRFSRQSFLGPNSEQIIEESLIGIVGLGGGGSHIVQQLAHIGFRNYVIYDKDIVEESNLNRLVGATRIDALKKTSKIKVATRSISRLHRHPTIFGLQSNWQDAPENLRQCDLVFGCVDGFAQRQELEVCCRRYFIPYIDIGMDVHAAKHPGDPPYMAGQVIVSLPGEQCMHCLTFLTEEKLGREAAKYGAVGGTPQVVWPNGVLASTAVGFAVDILTGWSGNAPKVAWLSYRGNIATLAPDERLPYANPTCTHFPLKEAGAPVYKSL